MQAQAMQRGEKFKESEARPRIEAQMEREMVLDWLQAKATIKLVEPGEAEETPEDILGASPEELAAAALSTDDAPAAAAPAAAAAPPAPPQPVPAPPAAATQDVSASAPPGGFEWGETF